jgi:hypothetical protein
MKRNFTLIFVSSLFGAVALAQDARPPVETLDVTMRLMPAGATLPDAVTKVIELPPAAGDQATESSSQGLETANEARAERGNPEAAERGEQGRERGQQMREQAQENRENAGRGGGPPESPGPPDTPGGPPGGPPTQPPGGPPG